MLKVLKNKLEQGNKTSSYPKEPISLYHRFRGLPVINSECSSEIVTKCARLCPQDAIDPEAKTIDLGRCSFCGQCEKVENGAFVKFSENFDLGTENRQDLITDGTLPVLADHSKQHFKKLLGVHSNFARFLQEAVIPVRQIPTYSPLRFLTFPFRYRFCRLTAPRRWHPCYRPHYTQHETGTFGHI